MMLHGQVGYDKNKKNLPLATVLLFCYYRVAAESEVAMGKIHFTVYRTTAEQFDLPVCAVCYCTVGGVKKPNRVQTGLRVLGMTVPRQSHRVASRVASECFEQLLARPTDRNS